MQGLNSNDGGKLGGVDHLRQSIRDILTTPIGSRVMRRDYGSRLYSLIDKPYSGPTRLAIIAATAEALITWEPRLVVEEVILQTFEPGKIIIDLAGRYLPNGREVLLDGIEVS